MNNYNLHNMWELVKRDMMDLNGRSIREMLLIIVVGSMNGHHLGSRIERAVQS